jgi:hypothetical protein
MDLRQALLNQLGISKLSPSYLCAGVVITNLVHGKSAHENQFWNNGTNFIASNRLRPNDSNVLATLRACL